MIRPSNIHSHLSVMACRWASSSVGRYMMMPTQECTVSGRPRADAGLIDALLEAVQRCSMGDGAGTPASSISRIRSFMKSRSALLGFLQARENRSIYLKAYNRRGTPF